MRAYGARHRALLGSALQSRVAQWAQRSFVRSIQRGIITVPTASASATATITTVDPNNASLRFLGSNFNAAAAQEAEAFPRLAFTNATTITASRITALNEVIVSFEVIEYWPGVIKSVQRGTVAVGTPATITAVTTTKAECVSLGFTNDIDGDLRCLPYVVLTNATTVTATAVLGDGSVPVMGFQVIEYF